MVAHIAGQITNKFPSATSDFIKNLLLQSCESYDSLALGGSKSEQRKAMWRLQGYGLPNLQTALNTFDNRVVLLHEGDIGLKQVQIFTISLPPIFFSTKGYKKISVVLTFTPPTRSTRGDSYLGLRLDFKLFHSVNPNEITAKFAEIAENDSDADTTPSELRKYEIDLLPGSNIRKAGCHQKGVKEFIRDPQNEPNSPICLVLMSTNKWIQDITYRQKYCLSLTLEHYEEVNLYETIRTEVTQRVRIR